MLAISAGATFMLALAAFWAIWQNHKLQKRERREKLLNEIIEWATEAIEWDIEKDYLAERHLKEAEKPLLVILMQLFRLSDGFYRIRRNGKLILRPRALILKQQSLTNTIDALLADLQNHIELIALQEIALMKDIETQVLSDEFNSAQDEVIKHTKQLDESATKVISEATDLQTNP